MRIVNPCVCGMGVNVPASMLPRSTSTPVILGQYDSVRGVGIAPIIPVAIGALALVGGFGYLAGRGNTGPQTLSAGIGVGIGDAVKWIAIAALGYRLYTGKSPLGLIKK